MNKKAGRPKKAFNESRHPSISARLTRHEEGQILYAIKRSGLRKSDWIRKALLYVAVKGIRIT